MQRHWSGAATGSFNNKTPARMAGTLMLVLGASFASAAASATATATSRSDQSPAASVDHDHHYAEPNYHYRYSVASRKTGDVKGAWEKRAGQDVWGAYFLRDPDGRWRTVHYEADDTGFYATVQRRPIPGAGDGKQGLGELGQQDGDLPSDEGKQQLGSGSAEAGPLDDATWNAVLAAAKESSREESHPALQKKAGLAMAPGASTGLVAVASDPSYTAMSSAPLREPPREQHYGGGRSMPRPQAYTRATFPPPREEATFASSPATTARPSAYSSTTFAAQRSPRGQTDVVSPALYSSYSSTRGPQPQREQDDERPTPPPIRLPSYSSYYATRQPPLRTQSSPEDHAEQQQQQKFGGPKGRTASAQYRVEPSNDDAQQVDGYNHNYSSGSNRFRDHDDEKEDGDDDEEEQQRDDDAGEGDGEGEHHPDDDHEAVPEQTLLGSQVRHEHEVRQVHSPQAHNSQLRVHHHQARQQLQKLRESSQRGGHNSAREQQLLGPAWAEVASHSALFDGHDWPGLSPVRQQHRRPAGEETPQDTQDMPTWVQRERVDRGKGRRGSGGGGSEGRGRAKGTAVVAAATGPDRGASRWVGRAGGSTAVSRGGASAAVSPSDRHAAKTPAWSNAPPPTASTWSYGSKVRGKEDGPSPPAAQPPQPPQSQPPKRGGKNQNRGPVLFAHQHLEASTPAGNRRPPPLGYEPPRVDEAGDWLHVKQPARQPKAPVSYSGWVPVVGASLQVAESSTASGKQQLFGNRKPPPPPPPSPSPAATLADSNQDLSVGGAGRGGTRGREGRGRGRPQGQTLSVGAHGDQSRANVFWKQSWN